MPSGDRIAFGAGPKGEARETESSAAMSNAVTPLPNLVVRLASTLVLAIGGMMIIQGRLTIGQYVQDSVPQVDPQHGGGAATYEQSPKRLALSERGEGV